MWIKSRDARSHAGDAPASASEEAQQNVEYFLRLAFENDDDIAVLNDLCLTAVPGRTEPIHIDHLVVHRYGVFVIESGFSDIDVEVRFDAQRHIHALRQLFEARGFEKLAPRFAEGLLELDFESLAIQVAVAISSDEQDACVHDHGESERLFAALACDADRIVDFVSEEIRRHRQGHRSDPKADHGSFCMAREQVMGLAGYLCSLHDPDGRGPAWGLPDTEAEQTFDTRCDLCGKEVEIVSADDCLRRVCPHCGASTVILITSNPD